MFNTVLPFRRVQRNRNLTNGRESWQWLDVYKFFINSLINSKISGDVNFEKNLENFVKKLEDDLTYSQEVIGKSILGIEADIRSANKKILFLDKKTVEEANQCYAGINRKILQRRLIS
ncbi:MAG: hypothetical protein EOO58_04100 [Hymenobacter sp.]|nr:MAG: hypothetical protein EOO58_04100 [Hymenobacter sp.]